MASVPEYVAGGGRPTLTGVISGDSVVLAPEEPVLGLVLCRRREARLTLNVRRRATRCASSSRLFFASFSPGLYSLCQQRSVCQVTCTRNVCMPWLLDLPVHYRHHHSNRKVMPSNPRAQCPDLLLKMLCRIFRTRLRTLLIHRTTKRTQSRESKNSIRERRDEGFQANPSCARRNRNLSILNKIESFIKGVNR